MNHLYESQDGLIHLCEDGQIVNANATYVVWTLCKIDVPECQSFKSGEAATCPQCKLKFERRKNNDRALQN